MGLWFVCRVVLVHTLVLLCAVTSNHKDYKWINLKPKQNGDDLLNINRMLSELPYDIDHLTRKDLLIAPGDFGDIQRILNEKRISYEIITMDVQKLQEEKKWLKEPSTKRVKRSVVENDVNKKVLSYPEILTWLEMMQMKYNNLMRLHILGKSYENRDIHYVKINYRPGRKIVVIEGGIHAREWASVSSVLSFIQKLLRSMTDDPNSIFSNYSYIVIPLLNPDGYVYTHTQDRMWRKNRAQTIDTRCYGIDLNRNFNANWNSCTRRINFPHPRNGKSEFHKRFAKTSLFCGDTYSGKHPHSENESKIVARLFLPLKGQIKVFISLHSYGDLWIYPYGHTSDIKPPNHNNSIRASTRALGAISLIYNITFELGTVQDVIGYIACGSSMDWMVEKMDVGYAYTLEITNPRTMYASFDVQDEDLKKYGGVLHTGVLNILEEIKEIEN